MIYLHPWEIDPEQPVIPAPWRSRFRHYQNLDSTERKLTRLLEDFSLCSMEDVLAEQQKLTRVAGVPIVSNVPVVPEV
jgi:hypothetical protein